ncbi:HipA domain-containing protein [Pelodictyon luteolum]|uniref:HipA domain-containing protein n=1 Tax=Pelodictyon luteolum TaxID=1100 RepID=UPI00350E5439
MLHHIDSDDAGYLEIAEFIASYGEPAAVNQDLHELFTRTAFNVDTAHRDLHLRNHLFLRSPERMEAFPRFPNPAPFRGGYPRSWPVCGWKRSIR